MSVSSIMNYLLISQKHNKPLVLPNNFFIDIFFRRLYTQEKTL